jgi:thiamine biosynthesis lipoprotein
MAFSSKTRRYLLAFLIIGWTATLVYFIFYSNRQNNPLKSEQLYRDNRMLMGTFWNVLSPDKKAGGIVFKEASRIEQLLSKYIESSEISRLNRLGKLKVSPDTFYIIKKSKEFWLQTSGAFDITVAPLADLWGFTNQQFQIPADAQIRAVLKLVGSDKIILHEKDNVVEFKIPGMKVDLGAIAKGFALDCAVKKLKERGIGSCLINAGGQVYALGGYAGNQWKIAVQNPRNKPGISRILELKNISIATSGDYEQFFFEKGKRYCHILNPKTGYPVDSGTASATAIDRSGLTADALSTAAFISGKTGISGLKRNFPETEFSLIEKEKP